MCMRQTMAFTNFGVLRKFNTGIVKNLRMFQYRDRVNCLIELYMHSGADAAQIATAAKGCSH